MWSITSLHFTGGNVDTVYDCSGISITETVRGPEGTLYRIVVGDVGYLDLLDTGHRTGGPNYWSIQVNGLDYIWYDGQGAFTLEVTAGGTYTLSGNNGLSMTGSLLPLPQIAGTTIDNFNEMVAMTIVPYQNPPSGTPKTTAELEALAAQYYPGDTYGYSKALCLYDWTSASFIRQDLFNQLQYASAVGHPLDLKTMARVIWGCDYEPYTATHAAFMHSFSISRGATSEADVYALLLGVYETIKPLAISEMDLQCRALLSLPNPTVAEYPVLYRGAMSMSGGYTPDDFSPSMFECPLNATPDQPLVEDFNTALTSTLAPGKIITTKGPWSFSNDEAGAEVWQNGILITCNPPAGAVLWPSCADITAFSLNPGTFEINMPPRTRYRIESYEWITIKGKQVCHFTMTILGYCVEPLPSN